MIDLYTWRTPNGRKIPILLEELGLAYAVHPVDISKGEQFSPSFLKISPNNKIPAIIDRGNNVSLFESGAILIYLAEKTGSDLLPKDPEQRAKTLEWLMWQMGGLGPMFGQLGHFLAASKSVPQEQVAYGIQRYKSEVDRLLHVLDKQLEDKPFLIGDWLTIADIAIFPWLDTLYNFYNKEGKLSFPETPNIDRWEEQLRNRDAFKKGMAVLSA